MTSSREQTRRKWKDVTSEMLTFLRDCFWALPDPLPSGYEAQERRMLENDLVRITELEGRDAEELRQLLEDCKELLARERNRKQGIEGRLTSIVGIISVAASILFVLLTLATGDHRKSSDDGIIAFFGVYIIVQLIRSFLAAISGLQRREYLEPVICDLLPTKDSKPEAHVRRQMKEYVQRIHDHRKTNDKKVTQMAIAHRALQNSGFAVLLASAILMLILILR